MEQLRNLCISDRSRPEERVVVAATMEQLPQAVKGETSKDAGGVGNGERRTPPRRPLDPESLTNADSDPVPMGLFGPLPHPPADIDTTESTDCPATEDEIAKRFGRRETPTCQKKKKAHVHHYEADEDGTVFGLPWGYSDSVIRGSPSNARRRVDPFTMNRLELEGFAPVPLKGDDTPSTVESEPKPTNILFSTKSPNDVKTEAGDDTVDPQDEWYLHVDPEVYEQCWTVYSTEFLEEEEKTDEGEEERAKRRRMSGSSTENKGIVASALQGGKSLLAKWR